MSRPAPKPKSSKPRETARHLEAFEVWYGCKRNYGKTKGELRVEGNTLDSWIDKFNWHERADERDAKALKLVELSSIRERANRLIEQRELGTIIRKRSMNYFIKNEIKDEKTALSAAKTGIDIERQAEGLPDFVIEVLGADDEQLNRLYADARRKAEIYNNSETEGISE